MVTKEFFQTVIDTLDTAVMIVDHKLVVQFLNPSAQTLLGVSAKQIEGSTLHNLFISSSEFISATERALQEENSFTKREIDIVLANYAYHMKIDCTFSALSIHDSQPQMLIELRQVDKFLKIARDENRSVQQNALKELVKGLAHEVKNPLGGLRGAAQLLEKELPSEDLKEYTQVIIDEADRLHKLVDEMLGPNKLLKKKPVNIHRIIEHVSQLIMVDAPATLQLEKDYDPSIPDIEGDQDRLIQATLNIMQNARLAVEDQGTITIRTRTKRQYIVGHEIFRLVLKVQIKDNGPGIEENMIDQIFYPMVTTRAEGTGLGLSISQTILNQHGGLIECESEPGRTIFSIILPLKK